MLGRLSSWLASLPLALCCSHCVSCARGGSLAERRRCGLVLARAQIHRHQASMLQFDNLSIFPFKLWSFPYFLILPVPTFIVSLFFNHPWLSSTPLMPSSLQVPSVSLLQEVYGTLNSTARGSSSPLRKSVHQHLALERNHFQFTSFSLLALPMVILVIKPIFTYL